VIAALLIALREGVEAALVVGIVLVTLDRAGRRGLRSAVGAGLGLALLASGAGVFALERLRVNQEGLEGLLMLVAAVFVATMVVWMARTSRRLGGAIAARVEAYAGREPLAARLGIAGFVFLLVGREGLELAIMLRAVQLSSEGLSIGIGALAGVLIAAAVGLFFFKGTLRVPLGRFFRVTGGILMVVVLQLALTGVHEMSEGMWIPSSAREMAIVGPIVRNDIFFFVLILGAAGVLTLREWLAAARPAAPAAGPAGGAGGAVPAGAAGRADAGAPDRRLRAWESRVERHWLLLAATALFGVVVALTGEFVYARVSVPDVTARPVEPRDGVVRIPVAEVQDAKLHHFSVEAGGTTIRFLVIRKPGGGFGTALDACLICGPAGYHQEGANVICRNCGAAIYIPSMGDTGGCNPIGVPSRVDGSDVVIAVEALAEAASLPRQRAH
jgi:high-affinity iron transporter